jgi:hypothetical protein
MKPSRAQIDVLRRARGRDGRLVYWRRRKHAPARAHLAPPRVGDPALPARTVQALAAKGLLVQVDADGPRVLYALTPAGAKLARTAS